jgi:hypothetical protein
MKCRLLVVAFAVVTLAMGFLLTACGNHPAQAPPTPDVPSFLQFLSREYYDPNPAYVAQIANGKMVSLWASGTEVPLENMQETWTEAQRHLEEFKVCSYQRGLGTIVVLEMSTPARATGRFCHNWMYQVRCGEVYMVRDGGPWKVSFENTAIHVYCDPPAQP